MFCALTLTTLHSVDPELATASSLPSHHAPDFRDTGSGSSSPNIPATTASTLVVPPPASEKSNADSNSSMKEPKYSISSKVERAISSITTTAGFSSRSVSSDHAFSCSNSIFARATSTADANFYSTSNNNNNNNSSIDKNGQNQKWFSHNATNKSVPSYSTISVSVSTEAAKN